MYLTVFCVPGVPLTIFNFVKSFLLFFSKVSLKASMPAFLIFLIYKERHCRTDVGRLMMIHKVERLSNSIENSFRNI
jgi:hypothetical protein